MTLVATSRQGCPIRVTDERWAHVTEEHPEMAGLRLDVLDALQHADRILAGNEGERLAVREHEPGKWIVAVYREGRPDGFLITAFLTRRVRSFERRHQIWP